MSADELISVIIPAYNVERYVGRTLTSVLAQTHANIEIIVVDDGSTDGTADVAAAVASQDRRVRLIRSANIGVSAARNLAIGNARGSLIAPIDGDDLWRADKLARQLQALRAAGPRTGVVYCWSAGINESDRIILPIWNTSTASGFVLHDIIVSGIVGNGSVPLIRREYIDAVGGYDETLRLCEDWKFYTALAGVCEFAIVPDHLTGYRLRPDSASLDVAAMEAAVAQVTAWIQKSWPSLPAAVLRDRRHVVEAYLAVLAVRQRLYARALHHLGAAFWARPNRLFDSSYLRLFALLIAHSVGLRHYRWAFWREPPLFGSASGAGECQRPIRRDGTPIAASSNSAERSNVADPLP